MLLETWPMTQSNEFHSFLLHKVCSTVFFSQYDQVEKDIREQGEFPRK